MQKMGRWAAVSPLHDPTLPLSPASFMMSLRTMLDRQAAKGVAMTAGMTIGSARFFARLKHSHLEVVRGLPADADLSFEAATAPQMAALFYGNVAPVVAGVTWNGPPQNLPSFLELFNLPPKVTEPD
ncbi:hypothetical protein [Paracoccus liaowanqingii]|uniref:hypothetical protein n=1 Tax=Paracoccus liaowanqingii TaxID=2560053 RepID=UPI001981398C|nr:hypothetical protein [Paracoccus liaowanqingii]